MSELAGGQLGSVGKYDIKFEGGNLVAEVDASAGPGSLGVVAKLEGAKVVDLVLDLVEKAIPGDVEVPIVELIRTGVKSFLASQK